MSSASTPSADEKARKIKSLLQSYYTADQDDGDSNRIDGSGYSGGSPARSAVQHLAAPGCTGWFLPQLITYSI